MVSTHNVKDSLGRNQEMLIVNEFGIYGYAVSDEAIAGDVNADGKFDSADAVMMQRCFLGSCSLTDRKAGDLNQDNVINILDLCIMKHRLIN